jgi:hypothetical protein
MRVHVVPILLLAILIGAAPVMAEGEEDGSAAVKALERQIEEMQRQMKEMERRNRAEADALRKQVEALEGRLAVEEEDSLDAELDRLLREADEEGSAAEGGEETTFIARGLGLQALNPEISVAGDFLAQFKKEQDELWETDWFFRVLDIHVESYLDPYTKLKAAVGVFPDGASLGEAYVTRFGVLPDLNLTAGKFRQQFGVVNRWHKHALDQIDFPMPLMAIFGPGGLNQTGFSAEWVMGEVFGGSQEAIVQLTEGDNGRVFGENSRHLPCGLLRLKNFRDLDKDTWLELGLTGMVGWNDQWAVLDETTGSRRTTWLAGADLTVRWEPTDRMRYANFEWRTEAYYLRKSILAPDGSGSDALAAFGVYSSLQRKLSRTVEVGLRLDYYKPDHKDYAEPYGLDPLAYSRGDSYRYQVSPYVTWWQSPFVRVRFEVDYLDGRHTGPGEWIMTIQITFAAGPHKHERY